MQASTPRCWVTDNVAPAIRPATKLQPRAVPGASSARRVASSASMESGRLIRWWFTWVKLPWLIQVQATGRKAEST